MLKSSANNIPTLERSSDLNNNNSTTSPAPTAHSDTGIWTLTHHHHLHHHHHHHHHRRGGGAGGGREEEDSEGDNSSGHHSQHSRSHSQHSHGQDRDKDRESTDESDSRDTDTTSEEDSIELQLEDFKLDDIDLEEYEVIELDIDQLGLGKEDIANALSHEEVLEKLSRSLHDLPLPDDEDDSPSELQGSKIKKKMRRSRLSNVFVGLPRKIRIVRPKVVHNILNVLEKNTLEPIPMIVTVLSILSAINSICFCFADILIEILMAAGAAYHLTFRLSYLILVILSALIGVFTLIGIRKRELDMTREALVLGFVVETGLLVSDCYYVFKTEPNLFPTLSFRLAFMIGSVFNIFCVVVMFWKLHLTTDIQKLLKKEWKKRRVNIHFPSPSSFFSQNPASITQEPHNEKQQQQPEEPPTSPAMEIV